MIRRLWVDSQVCIWRIEVVSADRVCPKVYSWNVSEPCHSTQIKTTVLCVHWVVGNGCICISKVAFITWLYQLPGLKLLAITTTDCLTHQVHLWCCFELTFLFVLLLFTLHGLLVPRWLLAFQFRRCPSWHEMTTPWMCITTTKQRCGSLCIWSVSTSRRLCLCLIQFEMWHDTMLLSIPRLLILSLCLTWRLWVDRKLVRAGLGQLVGWLLLAQWL